MSLQLLLKKKRLLRRKQRHHLGVELGKREFRVHGCFTSFPAKT